MFASRIAPVALVLMSALTAPMARAHDGTCEGRIHVFVPNGKFDVDFNGNCPATIDRETTSDKSCNPFKPLKSFFCENQPQGYRVEAGADVRYPVAKVGNSCIVNLNRGTGLPAHFLKSCKQVLKKL
ncbi:hypothetical protein Msil_3228 [Methylocella silvestris BL2]|uniref:Uncharacterized protein n=2 Tax=Methylocella silvestris TaxID=199596 RepID=B8EQC2_METSB|nr:hypothetical protein Msil_3228 [Methylocella silvestris BL2]